MCWIGKLSDKRKLSKEEATQKCFKIVKEDLKSLYKDFQYEVGKTYSIPHLNPKKRTETDIREIGDTELYEGFHFYLMNCQFSKPVSSTMVLMCEIPEDAECYVNCWNEGVTNKITIREAIPYKDLVRKRK